MEPGYAAIWVHGNARSHVGRVDLVEDGVHLRDLSPLGREDSLVGFCEIADVRFAGPSERLADMKTLVVELFAGRRVRIAALELGAAGELAARIAGSVRHAA